MPRPRSTAPRPSAQLTIFSRGDALTRLGDIARIELGPQSVDSSSVFDGLKAVFVGIYATPTANPLTVIQNVNAAFPSIKAELPPGLDSAIAYDSTEFIRASIWEVAKTLGEAAVIVVVVIFLFLGNFRSTLIPIVTIPLSLVGVMIFLLALGYSINLLTLLALVLAIGLVVDDAIVVVENIYRHIEEGMTPYDASLKGAREIAGPVVSMTITLAAVYAPIGFVSGLTGALFREFAFTLAGSVVVSGIIALTLSPMMCSRLLTAQSGAGRLRALSRPAVRGSAPPLRAPSAQDPEFPGPDRADPVRGRGPDRHPLHDDPEGTGARRGPGHPVHAGQGAAIRQPRLHRTCDRQALRHSEHRAREGARVRHQRFGRRGHGLRRAC